MAEHLEYLRHLLRPYTVKGVAGHPRIPQPRVTGHSDTEPVLPENPEKEVPTSPPAPRLAPQRAPEPAGESDLPEPSTPGRHVRRDD